MRFQEKLRTSSKERLWKEYCGFLDMTLEEYMTVQRRLVMEQIGIWSQCELGLRFCNQGTPRNL